MGTLPKKQSPGSGANQALVCTRADGDPRAFWRHVLFREVQGLQRGKPLVGCFSHDLFANASTYWMLASVRRQTEWDKLDS